MDDHFSFETHGDLGMLPFEEKRIIWFWKKDFQWAIEKRAWVFLSHNDPK
jgi:hypothetical protein